MNKIMGTTKVGAYGKITLIKDVAKRLNVKQGDKIVFCEKYGEIVIMKA
jgi:bifunctional DNA-binding transcriptional regulator/antitoxin component of YhaV-PrlF toxin-antitoxin module